MYAVIVSGGKQHKVKEGDIVKLEKIEQGIGETVVFNEVLLIANNGDLQLGAPLIEGGKVSGEIVAQTRGDKIRIIKFRRRKHHMKQMGHRQFYTSVKITGIGDNAKEVQAATAVKAKAEVKKPAAKKASAKATDTVKKTPAAKTTRAVKAKKAEE